MKVYQRLVGLVSLSTGSLIDYAISAYQGKGHGESSLFSQMLKTLKPGDLLLADRYYCTYGIIALMSQQGVPVVFRNHAQKKTDFRKGRKLGAKDHLIDWKKPKRRPVWMSKSEYDALPETLRVREFAVDGTVYITTLIDPNPFPKKEIAELYQQRWKIELDLRMIKTDLKMDCPRCQTPMMVKKELAVYLLAYNLIRITMAQSALRHKIKPRSISFKAAVQLLSSAMRQVMIGGKSQVLNF